jgi:phasin
MSEQNNKPKTAKIGTTGFMDFQNMDFGGVYRDWSEKGLSQAKENYDKIKSSAEEMSDILEDTYTTAFKGLAEFNLKALEASRANINAAFDLARDLLAVKNVSEVVELQTSHARKQFETISSQAKELSTLAGKVATEASVPVKDGVQKVLKNVA